MGQTSQEGGGGRRGAGGGVDGNDDDDHNDDDNGNRGRNRRDVERRTSSQTRGRRRAKYLCKKISKTNIMNFNFFTIASNKSTEKLTSTINSWFNFILNMLSRNSLFNSSLSQIRKQQNLDSFRCHFNNLVLSNFNWKVQLALKFVQSRGQCSELNTATSQ